MLAALLALALNAGRWKIFATAALALALIRVYPADEGRVTTVRSFFGVHKIVVTPQRPVPRADARHHDSRRRALPQQ